MKTKDYTYFIENGIKIMFDNEQEAKTAFQLATGRLFSIMSRPFQDGDHEMYDMVKDVIMSASEYLNGIEVQSFVSQSVKDYNTNMLLQQS